MGAYGVSVEKEFTFRGVAEKVSNTYHYRITAPVAGDFDKLANAVVARDKLAHPGAFSYKVVRVWGPTEGDPNANQMQLVKDLTGNGTRAGLGPNVYKELTACVQIYVGRSPVKNRKVFVRKFIHLELLHSSSSSATTGELAAAEQTFWQGWFDGCKNVTDQAVSFDMVTPNDVLVPAGNAAQCLKYARIRQLHQ